MNLFCHLKLSIVKIARPINFFWLIMASGVLLQQTKFSFHDVIFLKKRLSSLHRFVRVLQEIRTLRINLQVIPIYLGLLRATILR